MVSPPEEAGAEALVIAKTNAIRPATTSTGRKILDFGLATRCEIFKLYGPLIAYGVS